MDIDFAGAKRSVRDADAVTRKSRDHPACPIMVACDLVDSPLSQDDGALFDNHVGVERWLSLEQRVDHRNLAAVIEHLVANSHRHRIPASAAGRIDVTV